MPDEPVLIFSEIGIDSYELRKIEIFRNGRRSYADEGEHSGDTMLSEGPLPSIGEIAADPQFEPFEITSEEFELEWARRHE